MSMNKAKRNELSNLLRRLADYIDNRSDEELVPLIQQAANLKQERTERKKNIRAARVSMDTQYLSRIARHLQGLESREAGEAFLLEKDLKRDALETLARILQLPVQRDDNMERLRAKIIENVIGSRLRSDAIQGGGRPRK